MSNVGAPLRRDRRRSMREDTKLSTARRILTLLPLMAILAACDRSVLDPAGDIALQQRDIIYISTALMLLIIVPVIALIIVFAWRYRHTNKDATYDPDFDHSTSLELVIWSAPLLIIICLGALTWWSTHLLDPFRPLDRVAAGRPVDPKVKPLVIQVVSLDWKWLFIYPEQGVASVNELVMPVDRPVRFELTSTNMMNTFYAPTLAGMIYVMPGMKSQLHAVINREGTFRGMSANYSGEGFSHMRFKLYGVKDGGFDAWVGRVKGSGQALDTTRYLALEKPSERVPAMYFASVDSTLFDRIYNRCVRPGTPCMTDLMHRDMKAGGPMHSGHGNPPPDGDKPKGALFKTDEEKGVAPGRATPPSPVPSGIPAAQQHQGHQKTSSLQLPAAPRTRSAA